MVKRRRRFKQTTTLAERLTREASSLRERARSLSPGPEQDLLWSKVRQAETALHIDEWLATTGGPPPANVMSLMGKSQKKRSLNKSSQGSP
jgi:hypothetical protein